MVSDLLRVKKARGSAPGPRWGLRPQTPICLKARRRGAATYRPTARLYAALRLAFKQCRSRGQTYAVGRTGGGLGAKPPGLLAISVALTLGLLPAWADPVWVATRTLHRGEIVRAGDAAAKILPVPPFDALPASRDAMGLEVRQTIFAGRALTTRDVGAPYLVKVSAPVDVVWTSDGIELELSGRALDSGAMGDDIRVLNPATSRTIHGRVIGEGRVEAGAP